MKIQTIAFNPLRVMVDDMETPVLFQSYLDPDGNEQTIFYVIAGGEKFPIQSRVEIHDDLQVMKLDQVLEKVSMVREEKFQLAKAQAELKPEKI